MSAETDNFRVLELVRDDFYSLAEIQDCLEGSKTRATASMRHLLEMGYVSILGATEAVGKLELRSALTKLSETESWCPESLLRVGIEPEGSTFYNTNPAAKAYFKQLSTHSTNRPSSKRIVSLKGWKAWAATIGIVFLFLLRFLSRP